MQRTVTNALPFTELPIALGNFDKNRTSIDRVIIHTMVGSWQAAAARFNNPTSRVSAHYGIKLDGGLIHWLEETNVGYHAGDYSMNQRSIGIEHEDGGNYNSPRPDALYTTSATLVRDICLFYGIPIDRDHIKKHSEVSDKPTGCPDSLDIDRIIREASQTVHPPTPPSNDTLPPNFPDIVHGSSQWDQTVSAYLLTGTLPKDASFADIQKVVAGYKSQATAQNNQVKQDQIDLAAAQQEVLNRTEQVSRLKQQLTDEDNAWNARYIALKNTVPNIDALTKQYEGTISALKEQVDTASVEKGTALNELAVTQTQLKQCQTAQPTAQLPDINGFSLGELLRALFHKLRGG